MYQQFSYQEQSHRDENGNEENPRLTERLTEMEDLLEAHREEIAALKAELENHAPVKSENDIKLKQGKSGESLAKQLKLNETLRAGMFFFTLEYYSLYPEL